MIELIMKPNCPGSVWQLHVRLGPRFERRRCSRLPKASEAIVHVHYGRGADGRRTEKSCHTSLRRDAKSSGKKKALRSELEPLQ